MLLENKQFNPEHPNLLGPIPLSFLTTSNQIFLSLPPPPYSCIPSTNPLFLPFPHHQTTSNCFSPEHHQLSLCLSLSLNMACTFEFVLHFVRCNTAPTISSLLHSCPGLATCWLMCKCCVTYLLTYCDRVTNPDYYIWIVGL